MRLEVDPDAAHVPLFIDLWPPGGGQQARQAVQDRIEDVGALGRRRQLIAVFRVQRQEACVGRVVEQ